MSDEELLDWLEAQVSGTAAPKDLIEHAPELTLDDAYRLQFGLMRRRAAQGDALIGYKAAYTSEAMQKSFGMSEPAIGSLTRSLLFAENAPYPVKPGRTNIEPEVAALMKSDLSGPGVTVADALRAIEGLIPAIEIAPSPIGGSTRSRQMGTAVHKVTGGIVLGSRLTPPHGIDLRLEGCVISVNGVAKDSGTGVEVMGNPLNVIAHIANVLGRYGEGLKAGMVVMTGSVVQAVPVVAGDRVLVEFARLGRVQSVFA
jgi:2-keto-4-pentenoate hydratase